MTDTSYLIKQDTLALLADAAREVSGEYQTLTPAQIVTSLKPFGQETWVRPSDWPNLDNIDVSNFEGVYLTYDLRKTPDYSFIGVKAITTTNATIYVERGHLENNVFVADDSYEFTKTAVVQQELDIADGEVQLWRISATDVITTYQLLTNSSQAAECYSIGWQPLVERKGRLPNVTSWSASTSCNTTSTAYFATATFWLENDNMILGNSVYALKSTYMYDFALRKLSLKTDTTAKIKVSSLNSTFYNCNNLDYIDLSIFDTSECTNMADCLNSCVNLKKVIMPSDTSNVTTLSAFVRDCISLVEIDLTKISLEKVATMSYAFANCRKLKSLIFGTQKAYNLQSLYNIFYGCNSLSIIDMSKMDMSEAVITDIRSAFSDLFQLTTFLLPATFVLDSNEGKANPSGIYNYMPRLTNFSGISSNNNLTFNSCLLTHQSLLNIIAKLPTVSTTKTLTIGQANKAKLTAEEIAVATNKGWTVA